MINYLLITLAALMLAFTFSLQNKYQKIAGGSQKAAMIYNLCLSIVTAIVFFVINGFKLEFTLYSVIMASAMAILGLIYTVLGFKILKLGGMTLYTLFLMTGGMTVPYVYGLAFLEEPFSVLRTIGLILIAIAVILSNSGNSKKSVKLILLCVAVFFLNGFVSVVSKLHQIESVYETVSSESFVIIVNITKIIMSALLLFMRKEKDTDDEVPVRDILSNKVLIAIILLAAIIDGVSFLFQLNGAKALPASVMYPFVTGGTIIFSAILGYVIFKEKPTKKLLFSVGICFVGTLLFL